MINRNELQSRDFMAVMDGGQFLTMRTSTTVDGSTQQLYLGYAHPGGVEEEPVWMIQRVTMTGSDATATLFAGGQARFNQVWSDRATLDYR